MIYVLPDKSEVNIVDATLHRESSTISYMLKSGEVVVAYRQVDDPLLLTLLRSGRQRGHWMCDSWDHNEPSGCSNPQCFKYVNH